MDDKWITYVEGVGDSAADVYMLPGQFLISVADFLFGTVGSANELLLSLLLSTVCWLLLLKAVVKAVGLVRRTLAKMRVALVKRFLNFRVKLASRKKSLTPRRQQLASDPGNEVHFDNLDLAVLDSAATLGPGYALTAPDLAKEFNLRPMQVQSSLEKLARNMMLVHGFGTSDDYQSYKLSRAGAIFLSMWKRNRD